METVGRSSGDDFELLANLTARLASTASLPDIVETVLQEIVSLGFGAVWMAVLDEPAGHLVTLKSVMDGVDTTHDMPKIFMLDQRQPISRAFEERRIINISEPDKLHIIDRDDEEVPAGTLALPRIVYEQMRGHPFAGVPLFGSRGQPVGALGLSSYRGRSPIPDDLLAHGLLRAFMNHLGIAMERALYVARLEQLNADLVRAHAAISRDARVKAVGELAAAVAHDLNNLASIALLAASVGVRSPGDAVSALPRIERANRAIGDLVARLQRAARLQTTDNERANIAQIVDDVMVMVDPVLREHSIALFVDVSADVSAVACEPALVHQVVLNLVVNAQDALAHVAKDLRRLHVNVRGDGGTVRLIVRDTGPGIAPDMLPRLFQPFVTTKGEGHLGLGLSAIHAALAHFGGTIVATNVPTGGAQFDVGFASAAPEREVEAKPAAAHRSSRRTRLLAVDDDPDITEVIRAFLEPLGYEVHTARGGDEALDLARERVFDIILCDLGMPQRNGLDVCSVLRTSGFSGKLVLMTGWDQYVVNTDRRASQCDMTIKKPFTGNDLRELLDSLVS